MENLGRLNPSEALDETGWKYCATIANRDLVALRYQITSNQNHSIIPAASHNAPLFNIIQKGSPPQRPTFFHIILTYFLTYVGSIEVYGIYIYIF